MRTYERPQVSLDRESVRRARRLKRGMPEAEENLSWLVREGFRLLEIQMIEKHKGEPMTFKKLFEAGKGDRYWCIEEDRYGSLYVCSNAETRTLIDARRHQGQDLKLLKTELIESGVATEVADRYIEQVS